VQGDKQIEGIDYTEKYAPVVNWSMVRALMILTVQEKLCSQLVDFTNAFAQAALKESVFVEVSKMYESTNGSDVVLQLNKSLMDWCKHPCAATCITLREG